MKRLIVSAFVLGVITSSCASAPSVTEQLKDSADPGRITAQLDSQSYLFKTCRSVYSTEKLNGILVIRFRVENNGQPSSPHVFENIGQSSALDRCLVDAAMNLQFDSLPTGLVANVEYPLEFSPKTRDDATRRPAASR